MRVITKAIGAATRLVRVGDPVEATRLIRKALTGGLAPASDDRAAETVDPGCCFGPAADASGLAAKLTGWISPLQAPPASPARPSTAKPTPAPGTGSSFVRRTYKGPEGSLAYKLYRPDASSRPTALVMMLHGCKQNADDFARGTRMNALADRHGFAVVYPEQTQAANASGCWNWFDPKHQRRGAGEPGVLAGIARSVVEELSIEPGRCFVAGLSAGGAMAAVLAELYPDLFAGVGIHSGLAYAAASDVGSAFAAMSGNGGSGLGNGWFRPGPVAPATQPGAGGVGVPAIIFHGDADHTVHASNADAILARITAREAGLRTETVPGVAPGGEKFRRTIGRAADETVRYETWTIQGAGHAWAGGSHEGSYTDPNGPDASAEMVRFFFETTAPA